MNDEIKKWEIENKDNIVGWEVHYGCEDENKVWQFYENYKVVIFKMLDKTKVEFKEEK